MTRLPHPHAIFTLWFPPPHPPAHWRAEGSRAMATPPLTAGPAVSATWPGHWHRCGNLSCPGSSLRPQNQQGQRPPLPGPPSLAPGGGEAPRGLSFWTLSTSSLISSLGQGLAASFLSPRGQTTTIDLHYPQQRPLAFGATFEIPFPGSALAWSHGLAREDDG